MSTSYYDVVIIGTDLSGLVFGAMCAKRGLRVLVSGQREPPTQYRHEGALLERRSAVFPGLSSSEVIRYVFQDLGLSLELRHRPRPLEPPLQVVLPDARITVGGGREKLEREIGREFPDLAERTGALFEQIEEMSSALESVLMSAVSIPPDGYLEQRRFRKILPAGSPLAAPPDQYDAMPGIPRNHPFRAFMLAPALFEMRLACPQLMPGPASRVLHLVLSGYATVDGGLDAFKDLFLSKITANCGNARPALRIDSLAVRGRRVIALRTPGGQEEIGAGLVVCNGDPHVFFQMVPSESREARFHNFIHTLQPQFLTHRLNIVLRREAIPDGMGGNVVMVADPTMPLCDDNLLAVHLEGGFGASESASETCVVSVTTRMSARRLALDVPVFRAFEARVIERLKGLIPFLDRHMVARHSPSIAQDGGAEEVAAHSLPPVFGPPLPDSLGLTAVACRTAYRNVLVLGDALFSGLGFEGAFLAAVHGLRAAEEIVKVKA